MSTEHCLMCFEALDAHLRKRTSLTLEQLQISWAAFNTTSSVSSPPAATIKSPVLARVAASDAATSSASSSSSSSSLAPSTPGTSTSSLPLTSTPLFVTWNTLSGGGGDASLRGCIGTFEAQPLAEGLPEYAVISAVHDTRFPPITASELPSLEAAVTLLTDFEEADDEYDWDIGTHGIRLAFHDRSRRYGATYLPDVAAEQGWTKDETLFSLVRKAGWMGSRSRWKDLDLKVTRYRGEKANVEYAVFKKWRDWVDAGSKT